MTGREAERRDVLQMLNDELELVEAHNLLFGSVQLREIIKQIEEGKHTRKRGTLDLDAIRNRHLRLSQMAGKTFCTGHVLMDLADCIGEIEQLREQRVLDNEDLARAFDMGWDKATAAVVEWLRERDLYTQDNGEPNAVSVTYWNAANRIENGEHRREEER